LTLASTCAVVEANRIPIAAHDRPGYYTSAPQPREAARDRSFADLARTERKRREAEQRSSRRNFGLGQELAQRELRA
jgi:hypothetical protein